MTFSLRIRKRYIFYFLYDFKINKFNANYIFACQEKNKLHQCEFCEFSSNYSRNMRLHEECHRRNEEFKCSLCNFSSHAKFTVDSHLKRDHRSAPLSETIHILKSETKVRDLQEKEVERRIFSVILCTFSVRSLRSLCMSVESASIPPQIFGTWKIIRLDTNVIRNSNVLDALSHLSFTTIFSFI